MSTVFFDSAYENLFPTFKMYTIVTLRAVGNNPIVDVIYQEGHNHSNFNVDEQYKYPQHI